MVAGCLYTEERGGIVIGKILPGNSLPSLLTLLLLLPLLFQYP